MFTFKVLKPARKMWGSTGKTTPKSPTPRLRLEVLEDRTMPSASSVFQASPLAVPAAAAFTSYLFTMMQQRIATIEQDLSNALYTVGQVIAQEVSAYEQQVDSLFGIHLGASNRSTSVRANPKKTEQDVIPRIDSPDYTDKTDKKNT